MVGGRQVSSKAAMSALGQKRTSRRVQSMSLYPRKRTLELSREMSTLGQKATFQSPGCDWPTRGKIRLEFLILVAHQTRMPFDRQESAKREIHYIFADAIAAQRAKIAATFKAINFKPKL